jgi:phosphatidylglycerophosphate synthase
MHKIDSEYENPFDIIMLKIVENTDGIYKRLNLTPNHITTLSLIFGILSAQELYKNNRILSVIYILIAYYYDCMDGYYARKYKMVTTFGDYYDHFSDIFKFGLLFYIMYLKDSEKLIKYIPFLLVVLFFNFFHLGCQEKLHDLEDHQPFMELVEKICPNGKWAKYTRFVGCGTALLVVIYMILTF